MKSTEILLQGEHIPDIQVVDLGHGKGVKEVLAAARPRASPTYSPKGATSRSSTAISSPSARTVSRFVCTSTAAAALRWR